MPKAKSLLKAGPSLHEAAREAIQRGDTTEALALLRQLQELLQLSDDEFSKMMGQQHSAPPAKTVPVNPLDEIYDPETPIGGYKHEFAEGGSAKKDERPARSLLKALMSSLGGAIPFVGEEGALVGQDVGERMYELGAYPIAGLKSQWYGVDPTTGEFEYAGPGSGPAYPDPALAMYDMEEYRRQLDAWKAAQEQTGAIPGIIDETAALPLLGGMVGVPTPEFAETAGLRTEENWAKSLESLGLEEPEGLVENTLLAGGMMLGQLPIPLAWANRVKPVGGWLKRVAGATPRFGMEFLSPIIEPKVANYIGGALFGGGLMTMLEPGDIPPDIEELVKRAREGDEEAYEQLKVLYEEYQAQQEVTTSEEEGALSQMERSVRFGYAGGGKVKGLTRRGFLKGLGATITTAMGAGKAARHAEITPRLKEIEEAIMPARHAVKKSIPHLQSVSDYLRREADNVMRDMQDDITRAADKDSMQWKVEDHPDMDMYEMFTGDADDYDIIVKSLEEGDVESAVKYYDNLDTASRESIYDFLEHDKLLDVREMFARGKSDYEYIPLERHPEYDAIIKKAESLRELRDPDDDWFIRKAMDLENEGYSGQDLIKFMENR
jgi:hypothetical protein